MSSNPALSHVGERALIERIRARAGAPPDWVELGIGDDAAVLRPPRGGVEVLTTDSLVEGIHFRREWTSPRAIGHKAIAVNLSDLAAMGAEPRGVLLSLALPSDLDLQWFDALIDGFFTVADRARAPLVGGNITGSPGPLVIGVTAVGAVHPRKVLTRGGGRPGHDLYLTGSIGAAAAGLGLRRAGLTDADLNSAAADCVARYEQPEARLQCGIQVSRNRAASACVDLSDGLADAARQLSAAGGTGVVLDAAAIPVHPGAAAWASSLNQDPLQFALSGGEDYELLFAVPPRRRGGFLAVARRGGGLAITRVGRLTTEPGCWLQAGGGREPLPEGFVHF